HNDQEWGWHMDEQVVLKHGGLGIASFTISVIVLVLIFALFAVAGLLRAANVPMGGAINTIVGLAVILLLFTGLIRVGLGIAGAIERKPKKSFPAWGMFTGTATIEMPAFVVMIGLKRASSL